MRIYLDNIVFSLQKAGGISVYWYELARRLHGQADLHFIDSQKTGDNLFGRQLNLNGNRLYKDLPLPLAVNRYLPTTARLQRSRCFIRVITASRCNQRLPMSLPYTILLTSFFAPAFRVSHIVCKNGLPWFAPMALSAILRIRVQTC